MADTRSWYKSAINDNDSKAANMDNKEKPSLLSSSSSLSSNRMFVLGCLVYFAYSFSIAVDSQFLSLFYKSKGYDGTTVGILFAIPPTTTFLSVFIWATVVAGIVCAKKNGDDDNKDDGNNGRRIKSFQILYLIILLAAIFQTSIAFIENPIYMMIFIYISGIFQSPIKPMLDAMIMDNLNDRSNFGKVRLFGIMGSGFGTNLGGFVLNKMQSIVDYDDRDNNRYWSYVKKMSGFDVLFIVRMVLTILPLICIRQFQNGSTCSTTNTDNKLNRRESENKKASQIGINTSSTKYKEGSIRWMAEGVVNNCFQDKAHLLFFIFVFIAGASGGVSDAFSYLRFQEAGCSTTQMGTSRLLSSIAGASIFWYSGKISGFLGIENVLILNLVTTGVRFSLLKKMDHPYYMYLVDLIRGTTFGSFWSSSTLYASQIGPPSLRATMLLLLNGIYNGIGRSVGSIVGGRFQAFFGTNHLFLYCSLINYALALVMVFVFYRMSNNNSERIRHSNKEIGKDKTNMTDNNSDHIRELKKER